VVNIFWEIGVLTRDRITVEKGNRYIKCCTNRAKLNRGAGEVELNLKLTEKWTLFYVWPG
jgi:hypothetical protein